jgi:hypothetical protein
MTLGLEAFFMIRTELQLRLPNSPGALSGLVALLDEDQVRVAALSIESGGLTRLIVNNVDRAVAALTREHITVVRRDVLWTVTSGQSLPAVLAGAAAAGVNIEYAYASSAGVEGPLAVVLGVEDAMRASSAAGI